MVFLKNVFGLLTLQVGVVALASIFIAQALCTLLVNIVSIDIHKPQPWIIMCVFLITLIVIWLIAFIGSYTESMNFILAANVLWTIYIILWLVLVILSILVSKKNLDVCIGSKCPKGLWLLNTSLIRFNEKANTHLDTYMSMKKLKSTNNYTQPNCKTECEIQPDRQLLINGVDYTRDDFKYFSGWPQESYYYGSIILIVLLMFFYIQLLLYSWQVLISYQYEMNIATNQLQ